MEIVSKFPKSFLVECWQNEYVEYFLETLREKEVKRPVTTLSSPQIMYRGFLILNMRRVTSRLSLGGRVLHAGVRLLDIFMDGFVVSEDRLLHVALICLLIATKFEVKGMKVPRFSEFCEEANAKELTNAELWSLEWSVLQHMRWDLCTPTVATFVEFYRPVAVHRKDYEVWCLRINKEVPTYQKFKKEVNASIKDFMNLTLSDMRFSKYVPSLVAAACVEAMRIHFKFAEWPGILQKITNYSIEAVKPKAILLNKMMEQSNKRTNNAKKRQYSSSEDDQGYCTAKSSPETSRTGLES